MRCEKNAGEVHYYICSRDGGRKRFRFCKIRLNRNNIRCGGEVWGKRFPVTHQAQLVSAWNEMSGQQAA